MRDLKTEVLIIGGGATGTGLVRDLAMRGFKTILVEKADLATGTTGRYHGLLHSGGRYVIKDPQAARECISENKILRQIMPECIEDTGGFFVLTPYDDPVYADLFQSGCKQTGIPCDEISITSMLRSEPLLNRHITRCFRVPDASADSFLAADLNAESARQYGAVLLRYHPVQTLLIGNKDKDKPGIPTETDSPPVIVGALCRDLVNDEDVRIQADLVVNAAGAWVGKIAATAGIPIQMTPGKGILMAVSHRVVNTVINRCKMPGDGDIIVPAHTVAVIGTTDVKVADPDHFGIEGWEVQLMLDEGEKLIPGFHNFRFLRAWAGVRPLYASNIEGGTDRDISRAFVLLDHAMRDGVEGLLTITGGKWTTYRRMAEVTADKVCEKLGMQRPCRTHLEGLPSLRSNQKKSKIGGTLQAGSNRYHQLGHRLAQIEQNQSYGDLICECELATRKEVTQTILEGNVHTLDDIRRDLRLGMGPCQAGFCSLRSAGLLHQLTQKINHSNDRAASINSAYNSPSILQTNLALRDFLQERWKGILPVLWGQQLRQERLNELVYINVLNAERLPGPVESRLSPEMYEVIENYPEDKLETLQNPFTPNPYTGKLPQPVDVLVIGAGLTGLIAAWQAAANGKRVKIVTRGWGATFWSTGCVDILGYYPDQPAGLVNSPVDTLEALIAAHPSHPYALIGINSLQMAIRNLQVVLNQVGYPLHGSLTENWLLPTALGTVRPTCLVPVTMVAGDLRRPEPMLIVGFEQFLDFYPALVAENLNNQGYPAEGMTLDIPLLRNRKFVNGMTLARLFDEQEFRSQIINTLKPKLGKANRIGFPSVLGLRNSPNVINDLKNHLGCDIFEIPGLPPSVPGIRLHNYLSQAIQQEGGLILNGMPVIYSHAQENHLQAVVTETGTCKVVHSAKTFVLAAGGVLGGDITITPPGYAKNPINENALQLPIFAKMDRKNWFQPKFLGTDGHPVFRVGLSVNANLQPVNDTEIPYYQNLYAGGSELASFDPIRERSLEGVAIATGYFIGSRINEQ